MRVIIITLGTAAALVALVGLLIIKMGLLNVATSWEDPAVVSWALSTASDQSIKRRAVSIKTPDLSSVEQIDEGFRSYREMCAMCHTSPGGTESPVTQGLNPKPPELNESAEEFSEAELFWVIKNGIRMTGMPAWGPSHQDEEIWDIVAFLKTLPNMTKEEYKAMSRRLEGGHSHEGGEHVESTSHADGHADHGLPAEPPSHNDSDSHAHGSSTGGT